MCLESKKNVKEDQRNKKKYEIAYIEDLKICANVAVMWRIKVVQLN